MATQDCKKALKRLQKDLQEMMMSPLPNISAAPLECNMLEWHCNILHNSTGNVYHLILFFPKDYPCTSPRLEIMPPGFKMENVVERDGEKGTQICLNIFSDFADIHTEWQFENGSGWSPSYTVQTLLLNLLSYIHDNHHDDDQGLKSYLEKSKTFVCSDCGHSLERPFPSLAKNEGMEDCTSESDKDVSVSHPIEVRDGAENVNARVRCMGDKIFDYVSREKFSLSNTTSQDIIFGYGIILSKYSDECWPESPCEFVTSSSFHEMCNVLGHAKSIFKENISHFLPLYITDSHGAKIKRQFEKNMANIVRQFRYKYRYSLMNNHSNVVINVFCHLLSSLVERCYSNDGSPPDSVFDGFCQIHRLFMWVVDTYPKVLKMVNKRLQYYISHPWKSMRRRSSEFDFRYCFALLSVCTNHTWESVAEVYLREHWRRSVKYYYCRDKSFSSMDIPVEERLKKTFNYIIFPCQSLAFHVTFLKMVKPDGISKEDILQRYEDNLCFPLQETVCEIRTTLRNINCDIKSFDDWFKVIGLPVPSHEYLLNDLKESVKYAMAKKIYLV